MKIYCIGYDLNESDKDYESLIEQIKSYGTWWHHLDSTWFIETNHTAAEIRDHLGQYIDSNDELLVFRVAKGWAGRGFSERAYNWLKNNWPKT